MTAPADFPTLPPCAASDDAREQADLLLTRALERMVTAILPGMSHDEKVRLVRRFRDEAARREHMHSVTGGAT